MTALNLVGRLTLSVPEAGRIAGLGRDAAYAAAERGELPVRRVGRRLIVPTHQLLEEVLGLPVATVAQVLGLPTPENSEAGASTAPATAQIHALTKSPGGPSETPTPAA